MSDAPWTDVLATLADPAAQGTQLWTLCAWLRDHDPVHHADNGYILVSRYADAVRVLADPTVLAPAPHQTNAFDDLKSQRSRSMATENLAMANPPRHTRLRRLVSRGFTPRVIRTLHESTRRACETKLGELADRLDGGETVDFHTTFSEALTVDVISALLGVPGQDRTWMARQVRTMLAFGNPSADKWQLAEASQATSQMADYFGDLAAQRRQRPQDDLISAWLTGTDSDWLDEQDLLPTVWLLWMAGFETPAAAIANSVISMIEHPTAATWLSGGTARVKSFVDESLRYDPPVMLSGVHRITSAPIVLDDATVVPPGRRVGVLIAAANHDPAVYPDPERFDPSRDGPPSLAFGRGIHNCLGQFLARMELEIALPLIHQRFPSLTLAEEPQRRGGLPVRTFSRLALSRSAY
jgi:cytochrome P450 family 114